MSQSALSIPGSPLTMATLKTTLEAIFAAINTIQSGAMAPSSAVQGSLWLDTSGTPTYILKLYTTTAGWISIVSVNITTGAISFYRTGGSALASAYALTLLDDADASTALTTLGVTAFAKTILDDANASAVLSTLGFSAFVKTLIAAADASAFKTLIEVSSATGGFQASLTERFTSATVYTKLKDINCPLAGTYDVRFELKGGFLGSYARIYVDGGARGTERASVTDEYLLFTEKITVTAGQNIQLYAKALSGAPYQCYVRNFSVQLCDESMTVVTD